MEKQLRNGQLLDLTNGQDVVSIWFNQRSRDFCVMLNAKVVKATKTFRPVKKWLEDFGELEPYEA